VSIQNTSVVGGRKRERVIARYLVADGLLSFVTASVEMNTIWFKLSQVKNKLRNDLQRVKYWRDTIRYVMIR